MDKPHHKKKRPSKNRDGAIPILRVKKGASLSEMYAAARRTFTAADLQKFTEIEKGVPAEQVLADLEAICHEVTRKQSKKS